MLRSGDTGPLNGKGEKGKDLVMSRGQQQKMGAEESPPPSSHQASTASDECRCSSLPEIVPRSSAGRSPDSRFLRSLPQATLPEITHTTPEGQSSKEIIVMEGVRVSPAEEGSEIL